MYFRGNRAKVGQKPLLKIKIMEIFHFLFFFFFERLENYIKNFKMHT